MHAFFSTLAAALRGGRQPRHLAIAVVLGFTAGAVCGWNLTFAALAILVCALNCRLWVLSAAAACGLTLATVGAPVVRAVGLFLLDKLELGVWLAAADCGPLVAMFGLDDYRVLGGLVTSLVIALPAAHAVARLIASQTTSTTAETAATAEVPMAVDSLLRTFGFPAACCATAVTLGVIQTHGRGRAADEFLNRTAAALDVHLTADEVDYSLWTGKLTVTNLRIADTDSPERTAVMIEQVEAQTDPGLFVRGRLACSDIQLAGILCDADARGQARPGVFQGGPTMLKEELPPTSQNSDPSRTVEVQDFVRSWNSLGERGTVMQRLVGLVERVGDLETPAGANLQAFTAGRSTPRLADGQPCPLVQVKRLRVDRLPSAWRFSPDTRLELTHLSSAPATAEHFAQLSCRDSAHALHLATTFHLSGAERKHALELTLEDVAAEDLLTAGTTRGLVELGGARFAAITGRGTATRDAIDLNLCATASNVRIAETAGLMAGLEAALWRQSLAYLGEYRLDVKAVGRWGQPKLQCTPAAIVEQLKHQLRAAGAHDLVRAVDAARTYTPGSIAARPNVPAVAAYPTTSTPQADVLAPTALAAAKPTIGVPPLLAKPEVVAAATVATPPAPPLGSANAKPGTAAPTTALTTLPPQATAPQMISPAALAAPAPQVAAAPLVGALNKPLPTEVAKADTKTDTKTDATSDKTAANAPATLSAPATLIAAKPAAPATTTTTRNSRPAIGIASDAAAAGPEASAAPAVATKAKSPEVAGPSTVGDRYAAARPTLEPISAPAPVAAKPEPVARTAELRQPLSVLDPSAAPGPVNMSVGYTEERSVDPRSVTTSGQQVPSLPRYAGQPDVAPRQAPAPANSATNNEARALAQAPSPYGAAATLQAERPMLRQLPSQAAVPQAAGPRPVAEPQTLPLPRNQGPVQLSEARPGVSLPDNVEAEAPAPERREEAPKSERRGAQLPSFGNYGNGAGSQSRVNADGRPAKKGGLLGNFSLFGGKKEEEEAPAGESIEIAPPPRNVERIPSPAAAPEAEEKKSFPLLRSLFSFGGSDTDVVPPSEGAAYVDYEENTTMPAGANAGVRPSSYATDEAAPSNSVRQAAPTTTRQPESMTANESFYGRMVR
ncbi:MAG: hypothetical protein J0M17_22325 [Planctomycetes bacterium]|nr:hypothetical protein [Planctomycetota bacterium]